MKNEVLRTNLWLQYVSIVGHFAKYYSEMLTFEVRNLSHYTIGLLLLLRVYCCVGVSTVGFVALRRCMLHCQLLRFVGCLRDLLSRFRIRYVSELHFVKCQSQILQQMTCKACLRTSENFCFERR